MLTPKHALPFPEMWDPLFSINWIVVIQLEKPFGLNLRAEIGIGATFGRNFLEGHAELFIALVKLTNVPEMNI